MKNANENIEGLLQAVDTIYTKTGTENTKNTKQLGRFRVDSSIIEQQGGRDLASSENFGDSELCIKDSVDVESFRI